MGGMRSARVGILTVVALTALGGLALAAGLPESLRSSPQDFLESLGLEPEEPGATGGGEDGFDPAPLREGSEASEHASQTAIDVLTVIQAWRNGEFESGCEFGQAVSAAARGAEPEDDFDPCERDGSNGEEASGAGKAKGEEMSAAGKAKGQAAAEAGKAKGAEASAAGKAKRGDAPGGGASNGGGGGGSGPPSNPGPPPGAGPPGGTPGGP
ncbi:MAG TPA: hypothetical protein VF058_08165 [Actinomycetota bacterium]